MGRIARCIQNNVVSHVTEYVVEASRTGMMKHKAATIKESLSDENSREEREGVGLVATDNPRLSSRRRL
jgi:hypothetical protein